jgi:SAM-dependent methyltransferase
MTKTILILAANPQETRRLRLDQEIRAIRSIIQSLPPRTRLSLEDRGAIQPEDFQQELLDVNPQILHFCGHSSEGGLIVEDEKGSATTVTPEALASLLNTLAVRPGKSEKIECVILNSCYSEDIARAICPYVEFVIGTHQKISDKAAIGFSKGFYRGLGAGESYETAFQLGCNNLELNQIPEHLTPVLIQNGETIAGGTPIDDGVDAQTSTDVFNSPRGQVLWRLAYSFLRLDQIPSGGWGKTLFTWMDRIGGGGIQFKDKTRYMGGTDFTTYAFYYYCQLLEGVLSPDRSVQLLQENETGYRVYENFKNKTNSHGAVGAKTEPKGGEVPDVPVRHTLMGLIAFLLFGKATQFSQNIRDILAKTTQYLIENIPEWEHDQSHLFAMTAAAVKLQELLSQDIARKQLTQKQIESLQNVLAKHIPEMMALIDIPLNYTPQPAGQVRGTLRGIGFRPYYDFWRMERSNFLMYFPFLVSDDGQTFLPEVSDGIKRRCAQIFYELLNEIEETDNDGSPFKNLIRYHRKAIGIAGNEIESPKDWGLSAELAALLQMKAVRELLSAYLKYDRKRYALNQALLETFDVYNDHSELFKFTQAPAFGRILFLFEKGLVKPEEVTNLDKAIDALCAEGVTERGLMTLIQNHISPKEEESTRIDARSLRDFLVAKLESGEYTPDTRMGNYRPKSWCVCEESDWEHRIQEVIDGSTIAFYESELADKHIERYATDPQRYLTDRFRYYFDWKTGEKRTALDVGCGAGQYAALLAEMGFEVHLLDESYKMLGLACERLGYAPKSIAPVNIFNLSWGYPDASFDLIFASAIMIHVPEKKRSHIYSTFRRLLKPEGYLFVNYKINDHTLISDDGRFFAYYRDDSWPQRELENNGFNIVSKDIKTNFTDMYLAPVDIRWANFYCTRK